MDEKEKIIVNGKEVSKEELDKIREQENLNQIRLIELGKNEYRTRLLG